MGAWLSYGLGTANQNLPSFVVMVTKNKGGQPLVSRLWGSGFLPARHQGVRFRAGKDPVLYLNNPDGIDSASRKRMLDALGKLHDQQLKHQSDPQLETRIAQYELAFKMQSSVPEVIDFAGESKETLALYGPEVDKPGSYAANCRWLDVLPNVVFDSFSFIIGLGSAWRPARRTRNQCRETDQASAALVKDLKQRGMLEDTLVVWAGEFGRTNYCQGRLAGNQFGRDHHPRCYSIWMAGGGVKPGFSYGKTDDHGYNIAEDRVHVHDLQATILHLLGIDHERLTFRHQGRRYRLTDVHGEVVRPILA